MRTICVATFGRSDWSSCLPVARAIESSSRLELALVLSGTHLAEGLGATEQDVEEAGFCVTERVPMPLAGDDPVAAAAALGAVAAGIAEALTRIEPELLLVVGDRYELLAAAGAALLLRIPVAHVSGGDTSEGALDEQVRHAVTKLSHLHFVAMKEHAERLRSLGEEEWRIHVTGDPALDTIASFEPLDRVALERSLGIELAPPVALLVFHPTTLGGDPASEIEALLAGLEDFSGTMIVTQPNVDPGRAAIAARIDSFVSSRPRTHAFASLGQQRFYSLLAHADLLVGNSSSGIWEAPSFALPVVNVGERQSGRVQAANVIDVPVEAAAIAEGVRRATEPSFRSSLAGMTNPYGDGAAAPRVVAALEEVELGPRLLRKRLVAR